MAPRHRYMRPVRPRQQVDPNQTQLDIPSDQPPAYDPSRFQISPEQAEINRRGIAHVRGVIADNAAAKQQKRDAEIAASRADSPRDPVTGRVIVGGRAKRVLGPPAPPPTQPEPTPPRTVGNSGKTPKELIAEGYAAEMAERKNKGNAQ